ncbi:transmembrane protein 150C isoform 2-T3 [Menidia menidia]
MEPFSLWALLPPMFALGTCSGLWMVYFIAVYNGIVTPLTGQYISRGRNGTLYPPFISITGNYPPASCFFSEVMNLAAFSGFVIGVLRFLQLRNRTGKAWLNFLSLLAFSLGCLGMTLVGNFQLFSMMAIHDLGTLLTFGLGTLYCWAQAYLTLQADPRGEGRRLAAARFLLAAAVTLCVVLMYSLLFADLPMHAARCQWALVMLFLVFIGTLGVEFRHCSFRMAFAVAGRPEDYGEEAEPSTPLGAPMEQM